MPTSASFQLAIICLVLVLPALSVAQTGRPAIKVIDPEKELTKARTAARDTEHFEVGVYLGLLSVEDFNTNSSHGFALRYYFNEKFLIEGAKGRSATQRAAAEEARNFNPNRTFKYTSLSGGYQFLKGRTFWGKKRKYNSGVYALAGIEQVDFAGNSETGIVIGLSYKSVLSDWLTINLDFKDHIVSRDFLGDDKMTQNTEILLGINTIF